MLMTLVFVIPLRFCLRRRGTWMGLPSVRKVGGRTGPGQIDIDNLPGKNDCDFGEIRHLESPE